MKTNNKSYVVRTLVLVFSLIILGISLTYAYFTLQIEGDPTDSNIATAKLIIDSNLKEAAAINNLNLSLISKTEKSEKADKVEFYIQNNSTGGISAKYFVYLTDISITKNLYSEYFKWELVKEGTEGETIINQGTFDVKNITRTDEAGEDEDPRIETTIMDIPLNTVGDDGEVVGIVLNNKAKDNLIFRIWLENDEVNNQLSLTSGSFSGKLYFEAIPYKPAS